MCRLPFFFFLFYNSCGLVRKINTLREKKRKKRNETETHAVDYMKYGTTQAPRINFVIFWVFGKHFSFLTNERVMSLRQIGLCVPLSFCFPNNRSIQHVYMQPRIRRDYKHQIHEQNKRTGFNIAKRERERERNGRISCPLSLSVGRDALGDMGLIAWPASCLAV